MIYELPFGDSNDEYAPVSQPNYGIPVSNQWQFPCPINGNSRFQSSIIIISLIYIISKGSNSLVGMPLMLG